jgi:predicted Ser/Thr protein kinase
MVDEPTRVLGTGAGDDGDAGDAGRELPHIGPFRLLDRLGEGGMGVVWLAERREPVVQRVALKVIRSDRIGRTYRARFEMEQQALAHMDHPHVARLLDAGTSDGQSWFAMEYVPGQPLTDYCREHRLSLEQRLEVFQQICDGVQHAHMRGVLHRDLKPGNVLVREIDGEPVAKIIDFGLAQPVDPLQIRSTLHEGMRQVVGTLAYMSPEQAARTEGDLDTRTDVYSLGVMLYQLLTGELPVDERRIGAAELAAFGAFLRQHEPEKPSTRLSSLGDEVVETAAERGVSPARLRAFVRGDLDRVTMKALARDRQQRYASALDLGRDIGRFLRQEPVSAGPPGAGYVLRKWAMRHARGLAVAAGLVLGAVAVGVVVRGYQQEARAAAARRVELGAAALVAGHAAGIDDLWPADGANAPRIAAWLETADELRSRGDSLRQLQATIVADVVTAQGQAAVDLRWQQDVVARGLAGVEVIARRRDEVAERLARARSLRDRTVTAQERAWRDVRSRLASDLRFVGFDVQVTEGLVPLGRNPVHGLEEFYLVESAASAALPERRSDGGYDISPSLGIVFVLVPGGDIEVPSISRVDVRRGTLAPFLIARHELTQAQWARLAAGRLLPEAPAMNLFNPSNHPESSQRTRLPRVSLAPRPTR